LEAIGIRHARKGQKGGKLRLGVCSGQGRLHSKEMTSHSLENWIRCMVQAVLLGDLNGFRRQPRLSDRGIFSRSAVTHKSFKWNTNEYVPFYALTILNIRNSKIILNFKCLGQLFPTAFMHDIIDDNDDGNFRYKITITK
jgi:hypothetical protein